MPLDSNKVWAALAKKSRVMSGESSSTSSRLQHLFKLGKTKMRPKSSEVNSLPLFRFGEESSPVKDDHDSSFERDGSQIE